MKLHDVIEYKNVEEIKVLLLQEEKKHQKNGKDFLAYLNEPGKGNATPLHLSFRHEKCEITIWLLEKLKNSRELDKYRSIETYLLSGNKSNVKILILYGVTIPSKDLGVENKKIFTFAKNIEASAKILHDNYIEAEKNKNKQEFTSALLEFTTAADVWFAMAQEEQDNLVFKKHYLQKAIEVYQQANECYDYIMETEKPEYLELLEKNQCQIILLQESIEQINVIEAKPLYQTKSEGFFTRITQTLSKFVCPQNHKSFLPATESSDISMIIRQSPRSEKKLN